MGIGRIGGGVGKACTTLVPGDSEGGSRWTEFSAHPASKIRTIKRIPDLNTPLFCSSQRRTQDHSGFGWIAARPAYSLKGLSRVFFDVDPIWPLICDYAGNSPISIFMGR
jgi:hypothetical protein